MVKAVNIGISHLASYIKSLFRIPLQREKLSIPRRAGLITGTIMPGGMANIGMSMKLPMPEPDYIQERTNIPVSSACTLQIPIQCIFLPM